MPRLVFAIVVILALVGCISTGSSGDGDTTAPFVVNHRPADNAVYIDHYSPVDITFNEAIQHTSINNSTFNVRDSNNTLVSGTYEIVDDYDYYNGTHARFWPAQPLQGSEVFTVTVTTGITDLAGNPLGNNLSWSFTSAPSGIGLWLPMSQIGAPPATTSHTAVWTGSEMLIWGGTSNSSIGHRYNPQTDSWSEMSSLNAPSHRTGHTAVWTGTEMIIWGGRVSPSYVWLNDGARYNPATDTWQSIGLLNAPEGRALHGAVWTGSVMLIWGGRNGDYFALYPQAGGVYDPVSDTWTSMSTLNAPAGRTGQSAVWTGTQLIIWGGTYDIYSSRFVTYSGGRYDPLTDSWSTMTTANAPAARTEHAAVWSGSELIVWGGTDFQQQLSSGGKYNPSTDTWTATTQTDAPSPRYGHIAEWTGSVMIVWGGYSADLNNLYPRFGGEYDPINDLWTYTTTTESPYSRTNTAHVWTGNEMIVWGGIIGTTTDTGGRFYP